MSQGKNKKPNFRVGDKVSAYDAFKFRRISYTVMGEPYYVESDKQWWIELEEDYRYGSSRAKHLECYKLTLMERRKQPMENFKMPKIAPAAWITGAVLLVLFLLGLWFVGNYNSLVGAKAAVDNSWAKVETQYQRRLDLIDNLVASVKGAQKQEVEVFGKIADARKQYNSASTTEEKAEAASTIEQNVTAIVPRLQEAYPELKSNQNVTKLMDELAGTENSISGVRDVYNDTVTNYNVNVARFPKNIFASMFGFDKATLFKSDEAAKDAPTVEF